MTEVKDRKVILSLLWIFVLLNYIYADIFGLSFNPVLQPGVTVHNLVRADVTTVSVGGQRRTGRSL